MQQQLFSGHSVGSLYAGVCYVEVIRPLALSGLLCAYHAALLSRPTAVPMQHMLRVCSTFN